MKPAYYVYIWSGFLAVVAFIISAFAYFLHHLPLCFIMMVLCGVFFTIWGCMGTSNKDEYRRKFIK